MLLGTVIALLIFIFFLQLIFRKKKAIAPPGQSVVEQLLNTHVRFYQQLKANEQKQFLRRVEQFLSRVRITGVNTKVEDIDRVLVAAAAIIPIFHFNNWEYNNIHEVLLYPGSFNDSFHQHGEERDILGMVGSGALQHQMILSQPELRAGFLQPHDRSNTAIHEFVHLIDQSDGYTDGFPENLVEHRYAIPWLKQIHQEINLIREGQSDIDPYAITNEAEFFAVAAEYFFKQPEQMQHHHPALFSLLEKAFATEKGKA